MNNPSIVSDLRRLYAHFPDRRRRELFGVLGLMLIGAVAELVTLGAVLPFLALIADPTNISRFDWLRTSLNIIGWGNPADAVMLAAALFISVAVCAAAVRLLLVWVSQACIFRLGHDLGVEVYRRSLHQPYEFHVARNTSEIISSIDKVQIIIFNLLMPLMQALIALTISAFILAALFSIDPGTALTAALGFGGMYVTVSILTRRRLAQNSKIIASGYSRRLQIVQEGLGGVRDVLIDRLQATFVTKFARIDAEFRRAQAFNAFFGAAPRFVIEAGGMVLIAVIALVLSREPGGLLASLPVLGALALGAQRLLPLLQLVYHSWSQVVGTQHVLRDVVDLLDLPIVNVQQTQVCSLSFSRHLSFDAVYFRYAQGTNDILKNVSFLIKKGARIGIMGPTGSGKSTLMDLVLGLLQPTSGVISIDNRPLTFANVQSWQRIIAHVPQAIYLSDATIAENIAFGDPSADMQMVIDAARGASLHDFIIGLPGGYQTMVGERGVRLSGGQRQRIGIARALYKRASVLVFDEATSSLDTDTESEVMSAINALGQEVTVIIIAHRLSTLTSCNAILCLEAGRIVREGPPASIIGTERESA